MDRYVYDQLKNSIHQASIIDRVIQEYGVEFKKEGKVLKGRCPFHPDNGPSLTVYPETQSYYCFGCGEGGDVISFVMEMEKCGFMEAMIRLANKAGISLPQWSPEEKQELAQIKQREDILTAAVEYYHQRLTPEVVTYLSEQKGIFRETIDNYKIGYAPPDEDSYQGLMAHLGSLGIQKDQSVEFGLVYENGEQYFSDHIVFPNWCRGRVVYITGRGYPEQSHKKPLTERLPLYHLFLENHPQNQPIMITEGETDTLTLKQAGFNAWGILGTTGFKDEWAGTKFKNIDPIYIALDNDEAGIKASLRLGLIFNKRAKIVTLPEFTKSDGQPGKDWNDLFVHIHQMNTESFHTEVQKLLEEAQSHIEFKINQLPTDIPRLDVLKRLNGEIYPEIAFLSDAEQDHYIDCILNHFGEHHLKRQSLKRDIANVKKNLQAQSREVSEESSPRPTLLSENLIEIAPCQDFANGVGYQIVFLAVQPDGIYSKKDPYVITSMREFLPLTQNELATRRLILKSEPTCIGNSRWSLKSIEKYIHGQPDPFQPSDLFFKVRDLYELFLEFKEPETFDIMALWTIGTYLYMLFRAYPYILFVGEKASGKTRTLEVAHPLAYNSVFCSSITLSALFRTIEGSTCTLLIDEAEQFKDPKINQEIRSVLNAGYKKGGSVLRTNTETFETMQFQVYCPKMITNIKGLESVLESRCITFPMIRSKDQEKMSRVIDEQDGQFESVRDQEYRFALNYFKSIEEIYLNDTDVKIIPGIFGRQSELWRPILSIAKFIDGNGYPGLFDKVRETAQTKSQQLKLKGVSDKEAAILLSVKELVAESPDEFVSNKTIRQKMANYLEEEDIKVVGRWIGDVLRKFDLITDRKRCNQGYLYLVNKAALLEIIDRYGVE